MVIGFPIVLLVGAGLVWALVAFFTSQVNRVLKLLVALLLVAAVVVAAMLIIEMRTARIELVNNARVPLTELTVATHDGAKRQWVDEFGRLDPGDTCIVRRMVPDLRLDEVTFRLAGKSFLHDAGGLACWGETVVLTVTDNGTVERSLRH
ncbi:MAG TPA: hypothetical protein VMZ92_05595 [Planctomycetota bacterium]|nr:hypothetical protein [Planctomycetota bacterium]